MIILILLIQAFSQDSGVYHPDDVAGPHSPDVSVYPEDPSPEFWIFRDGGATIINAATKQVIGEVEVPLEIDGETLEPLVGTSAWGDAIEVPSEHHIYINDRINDYTHIFDTLTHTLWRSIKLAGGRPVHMYYVPQLHEVWTHTDATGAFDVIRADDGEVHHTQVQGNWLVATGHGKLVFDNATFPIGYATTTQEGRVIKINLLTKEFAGVINMTWADKICVSTHYIGYSRSSNRLWVQCSRGGSEEDGTAGEGTYEIDLDTEQVVQWWEKIDGGIHVSPLAEEYIAINMGGERICGNPGWMPWLEDCEEGQKIYPDGTIDFFSVNNGENGVTESHMKFNMNGGPSHVVWIPKASNPNYYWSVWAMVSSENLYAFDMEAVHNGVDHQPGAVVVGEMRQEGHGSRYLDVGGNYIVAQANEDNSVSIVDISDSDCLGRSGVDACPRSLLLHDTFHQARGIVYARPTTYYDPETTQGEDNAIEDDESSEEETLKVWMIVAIVLACLAIIGAILYVYLKQTVIVMEVKGDVETSKPTE